MEKCQFDINRYYQPESTTRMDQRKKEKYDEALEEFTRLEKLRDEVVKKMLDVTVFFTSLNLLYYTYEKYWFDEFMPEIRNCTSMCWSL